MDQIFTVSAGGDLSVDLEIGSMVSEEAVASLTIRNEPGLDGIRGFAELSRDALAELVAAGQAILDRPEGDLTVIVPPAPPAAGR